MISKWVQISLGCMISTLGVCATQAFPVNLTVPVKVDFNADFLKRADGLAVDVSRFERGNPLMPGEYSMDVYLNATLVGRRVIRFVGPNGQAKPCFTPSLITLLNLRSEVQRGISEQFHPRVVQGQCMDLGQLVEAVSIAFDMAELRLDINVPQSALRRIPQGYVNPEFWDVGVPSATLAYNLNTYHTQGQYSARTTYLGFESGANFGSWHFRQRSALSWQTTGPRQYQNITTYLQHDIPSLHGQLTLGDSYTDGAMFDSVGLRGVQLSSDDRMLPESQRGYAPLIRGVAQSNARVAVTQNGIKLYETTVSAGAFEISDLYATGYGGDLLVTVTEADGSQHSFAVPYASVVQLLRPGGTRYTTAVGYARNAQSTADDKFFQATVQHGFTNLLTGYGGLVAAEGYHAGLLGTAWNTPLGAVAVDMSRAGIDKPGVATISGRSVRLSYSKFVPTTRTNLTIAAHRYSSSGYWGLREALFSDNRLSGVLENDSFDSNHRFDRQRNRLQLTINQSLGDHWGSLYVTGTASDYWTSTGRTTQFQVGYSNMFRAFGTNVTYNILASRQNDASSAEMSNRLFASLSIPLGESSHQATLSLATTKNSRDGTSEQIMYTGSALEDRALSYGVNANRTPGVSTVGGSVQYRSPSATVSASASNGSGYSQYSAALKGAVVAHPGGATLANDLSDTIGIVEAKDAQGAHITNAPGVRIDSRGYAVIPYLTPYSLNNIELDPKGLPLDIEFKETRALVAPRANSVVMIRFPTVSGRAAMINVQIVGGSAPPFGAAVLNDTGAEVGIIGQGGRVLVRGVENSGVLNLRWGEKPNQKCHFNYQLPEQDHELLSYPQVDVECKKSMDSSS